MGSASNHWSLKQKQHKPAWDITPEKEEKAATARRKARIPQGQRRKQASKSYQRQTQLWRKPQEAATSPKNWKPMSKTNDRQDNHLSPNKDQGEKNKTNGRSPNLYKDLSYFNATFL